MLITFSCDAYENITMFGEVAMRLITMMGHSATVPGAILAKDIPEALSRLEKGINQQKFTHQQASAQDYNEDDEEEPISLANRALPLLNMLKAASKKQCNVMWQ